MRSDVLAKRMGKHYGFRPITAVICYS